MIETILSLLRSDGSIIINKNLLRNIGIDSALMFSELCSKYNYWKIRGGLTKDGYFYCTADDLEESSGLSNYQQKNIVKKLTELELISYKVTGLPPKAHYKIIATETTLLKILENRNSNNFNLNIKETLITNLDKLETNNNKEISLDNNTNNEVLGKPSNVQTTLVEVKGKPSFSNQYVNHKAVIMYRQKKGVLEHYTKTDWLMEFVLAYNVVFNSYYPLPPYGSQFNSLVAPFTDLVAEVKPAQRVTVFKLFNELVQRGSGLPDSFQAGYALEQLVSGWNLSKAKELMKHCANLLDFSEAKPTSSKSNQLF